MLLDGYVKSKNNTPIAGAKIEIKNNCFTTIYCAESNEDGYYQFDIPEGKYPFLTAVKDYAVNYLEYWCQNIPLLENTSLDISFDTLEIYGLHIFSVKGAGNGLMIYFRPMSLVKFQEGNENIAPDDISIRVEVDRKETAIIAKNTVVEVAADREMTAYLIQVEGTDAWNKIEIQIVDADSHYGAAAIFNPCV